MGIEEEVDGTVSAMYATRLPSTFRLNFLGHLYCGMH